MRLNEATVLIVDDELELLEIFSAWLGRSGCKVLTAANGAEALKILETDKVNALISDIHMPIVDGLTLVRRIYDMGLAIPTIIFVSGFGEVDAREMHALGVEAMIEKPLDRRHLLDALEAGLLEREELWLTPPTQPAAQTVALELPSLREALATRAFELGRGGCCFACDARLAEDMPVDLSIRFTEEGLTLNAHGEVRWYRADCARAGVAFRYLDPECRAWVIAQMKRQDQRRFIPRCA